MKTTAIVLVLVVAMSGFVALAPTVNAAPPDLPPNHTGCNYFHYHHGDIKNGVPPSYHYHHCF